MSRSRKVDWCVLNFNTAQAECLRCGGTEPFPLPMPVGAVLHWSRYFQAKHRWCKAPKPMPKEGMKL